MFNFVLTLAFTSLSPGTVFLVEKESDFVVPGKVNWVLRDPTFRVPAWTKGIILRVNPENTQGVAEVKVYDGTNRIGWVESESLSMVTRTNAGPSSSPATKVTKHTTPPAVVAANSSSEANSSDVNTGEYIRPRRKRRLPDFSEVNAAYGMMAQQVNAEVQREQASRNFAMRNNLIPGAPIPPSYGSGGFGFYDAGKTQYVHGYYRSNGTYVEPYYRHPPSR